MTPRLRLLAVGVALLCTGAMEVTTQTPVTQVLTCMRANSPARLQVSELRIESRDRDQGTRVIQGRFYSRRDDGGLRAMLHLTAPADLAGTRYLLVEQAPEDALYLYLPALAKTRRLSGTGPDSQIAGSSLRVTDLRLIGQALDASSITREGSATYAGREAHRLRLVPTTADSPYRRVFATVDAKTCVVLAADFQNDQRTLKQYRADATSLQQSGAFTYASNAVVDDLEQGATTRIALGGVNADARLSARWFDPKTFHKAD